MAASGGMLGSFVAETAGGVSLTVAIVNDNRRAG